MLLRDFSTLPSILNQHPQGLPWVFKWWFDGAFVFLPPMSFSSTLLETPSLKTVPPTPANHKFAKSCLWAHFLTSPYVGPQLSPDYPSSLPTHHCPTHTWSSSHIELLLNLRGPLCFCEFANVAWGDFPWLPKYSSCLGDTSTPRRNFYYCDIASYEVDIFQVKKFYMA